jgi:hypothetical protein
MMKIDSTESRSFNIFRNKLGVAARWGIWRVTTLFLTPSPVCPAPLKFNDSLQKGE